MNFDEINEINILSRVELFKNIERLDIHTKLRLINQAIELYKKLLIDINFEIVDSPDYNIIQRRRKLKSDIITAIKYKEELYNHISIYGINEEEILETVEYICDFINKIDKYIVKICGLSI